MPKCSASGRPRGGSDRLDMWALVDPTTATEPRTFQIVGTGNPIPPEHSRYIGTVPTHGGQLIWHIFEKL